MVGNALAMSLSLLGVGALLATSALAFSAVKWGGAVYLVGLGLLTLARSGRASGGQAGPAAPIGARAAFLGNVLIGTFHPKTIVFFVAFLPQFVSPEAGYAGQAALLVLTFCGIVGVTDTVYAITAARGARLLSTPRAALWSRRAGGGALIASGLATRRRSRLRRAGTIRSVLGIVAELSMHWLALKVRNRSKTAGRTLERMRPQASAGRPHARPRPARACPEGTHAVRRPDRSRRGPQPSGAVCGPVRHGWPGQARPERRGTMGEMALRLSRRRSGARQRRSPRAGAAWRPLRRSSSRFPPSCPGLSRAPTPCRGPDRSRRGPQPFGAPCGPVRRGWPGQARP